MRQFGWMRVAYLLLVLSVLTILVRMGDSSAEVRSLADRSGASEEQEAPVFKRWTEDDLSSLEDARASEGRADAPSVVEPRVPAAGPTAHAPPETPASPRAVGAGTSGGGAEPGPPVFYRPPGSGSAPAAGPVCGDMGRSPKKGRIVFPLERKFFYSYEDTWGAARPQGGHEGTDLMTPAGTPEYAVTDGTVVRVAGSKASGWNTLGGYAVMVRADYSIGPVKRGDLFYYAHLEHQSAVPIGTRVRAGQVVGYAGDTGQGPEVTRGLFPPHLHLGWYDGTGGRSSVGSGAMNPYPLLEWIKSHGGAVSGGSDARYCEALGPAPSAGDWPDRRTPGVSPDMDTGTRDPNPVARENARGDRDHREDKDRRENEERPDKPPEKKPQKDRPVAAKPGKPDRPNGQPSGPAPPRPEPEPSDQPKPDQPKPDQPKPDQPKPDQPGSSPTEDAYDDALADPSKDRGADSGPAPEKRPDE